MEVTRTSRKAVTDLVRLHPVLKSTYDENLAAVREVLPHLLMADFARFLGRQFADQPDNQGTVAEIQAILDTLDRQLKNGDYSVKNAVAVGFLQQLPSTGEPGTGIRELLSPDLRAVFDDVNW
jgi:hypothetical protein